MGERVVVCEVGPRDGLQMAHTRMATDAKVAWIRALAAAGLPEIEVGSFVPARVIPQMADTGEVVRALAGNLPATIVALAPNLRGAQAAYEAGAQRVSIPVSVSEGHSRSNLNRGPAEQVAEVARVVAWARAQPRRVEVEAACSTAFGCSIDGVVPTDAGVRLRVKITPGSRASAIPSSTRPIGITHTGQPGPCTSSTFSGSRSSIPYL